MPADVSAAALPDWPEDLLPPPFAAGERPGQLDVIAPLVSEPEPGRDLVVLLDGVGAELLAAHRALTPTLRRLEDVILCRRTRSVVETTWLGLSASAGSSSRWVITRCVEVRTTTVR